MLFLPLPSAFADEKSSALDIDIQEQGTAKIHAYLELKTNPQHAFEILTDYEHWNKLFPQGFAITLAECPGVCSVIADMTIPHVLVPWSTRLRAKSIEHPPHTFELHLLDGDYEQYYLRWGLARSNTNNTTSATMTLILQPKGWLTTWTPDFLYEWTLRNGLEDHFERIQRQVGLQPGHP